MLPYNARATASYAMAREYAGGSVSGILRKTGAAAATAAATGTAAGGTTGIVLDAHGRQQPAVELLVFGYACKIFRDDEKARELDHGKHLIPWMGDVNLKIDRYDVRGALCDLAPHEAPPGGYGNRLEYLSAEEQRAEQLCEEERYLFLYNNEEEHKLQQEEDLKRLQAETSGGNYSQVGFQYGIDGQAAAVPASEHSSSLPLATSEENEQPFVLPPNLLWAPAPDVQLPETMKQHAIIEKTARFIAMQGAQMEILIKAKQANNTQFDFLSQGGVLQPYYRHLLAAIKQGKYAAAPEPSAETPAEAAPPSPRRNQVITVPTIKYKPSANCAYTQLISKIKGVPLQSVLDDEGSASNSQHSAGTASPTPSCKSSQSNEFTPVLLQYNGSTFAHAPEQSDAENANDALPKVELLKNTSALALAQNYSSESETEDEEQQPTPEKEKPQPVLHFPVPEESLQHIIDKTATYVIKNGRQFEETLRTKSVERFNFLLPENEYYPYYMYKITGDVDAASKEEKTRKAAAVAAALMSKKGLTCGGVAAADKAPVCFSIRARDEHAPLQPALPQETSDDEDQGAKAGGAATATTGAEPVRPGMPDSVQRAIKQVETQLLARTAGGLKAAATASTEQRQTEERVKDKLALIARDKLNGLISREKQLQLERKRKVMAFVSQIKGDPASKKNVECNLTADAKAATAAAADSDAESNDSVRSIPITYFGPDDDEEPAAKENEKPLVRANADEEEEDGDDLEKYNLLNDDSTNTFTSKVPPTAATVQSAATAVLVSDDDDVQLITASAAPALRQLRSSRHSRSRHRSSSHSSTSTASDSASSSSSSSPSPSSNRHSRSRSRSHQHYHHYQQQAQQQRRKRKASDAAKSEATAAQMRRQLHRQRSRSASRSSAHKRRHKRRSRSRSLSSSDEERRYYARSKTHQREQRPRHAAKKSHKRHKRRRRSSDG